ncbi:MAG: hypothetical protein KAH32_04155 [Chlamydiia bacterium]|nr:hypothetical protein [Chlamydiia bacterium]
MKKTKTSGHKIFTSLLDIKKLSSGDYIYGEWDVSDRVTVSEYIDGPILSLKMLPKQSKDRDGSIFHCFAFVPKEGCDTFRMINGGLVRVQVMFRVHIEDMYRMMTSYITTKDVFWLHTKKLDNIVDNVLIFKK